jgi:hypothetical protein
VLAGRVYEVEEVRMSVPRVWGWSEEPDKVLMMERVNVEGSEGDGIQVILRGEVRSTVEPGRGDVNVKALEAATRPKARRRVGTRMLGRGFTAVDEFEADCDSGLLFELIRSGRCMNQKVASTKETKNSWLAMVLQQMEGDNERVHLVKVPLNCHKSG